MELGTPRGERQRPLEEVRVYRKRWLILLLSFMAVLAVLVPWMQYTMMANILVRYYGVDYKFIEWTTMIFSGMAMLLNIPGAWFLNRFGLRWCFLIGAAGATLGQWIKVLGCWPDRFWLLFLGQSIVATCFTFVAVTPPKIAATWFPANELSFALGMGFNGEVIGVAIGCALAPLTVRAEWTSDELFFGLIRVHLVQAALATLLLVATFFFYDKQPPHPPSVAQAAALKVTSTEGSSFLQSMKRIMRNKHFVLLTTGFIFMSSVNMTIRTMLNRFIVEFFPERSDETGWLGSMLTITGIIGILGASFVADRTKRYKELTLIFYLITVLILIGFAVCLYFGTMTILYIVTGFLGVFITALYIPGFEFAIELNYPEPEGNPTALLHFLFQPFALLVTAVASSVVSSYGPLPCLLGLGVLVLLGFAVLLFVPRRYRRQEAERSKASRQQQEQDKLLRA